MNIETKKEIEKLLVEHEDTFAPWELDEGNCEKRPESNMLKFGAAVYNLALENACAVAPINELQKAVIRSLKIRE